MCFIHRWTSCWIGVCLLRLWFQSGTVHKPDGSHCWESWWSRAGSGSASLRLTGGRLCKQAATVMCINTACLLSFRDVHKMPPCQTGQLTSPVRDKLLASWSHAHMNLISSFWLIWLLCICFYTPRMLIISPSLLMCSFNKATVLWSRFFLPEFASLLLIVCHVKECL